MLQSLTPFRKACLLFCFSLLTHMPGITSPILDFHGWAQTLRASTARNYYEHGMRFLRPEVDYIDTSGVNTAPQFPLYSYLVACLYKTFGPWDAWGRMLAAFFGAWSAVALYFLARAFLGDGTAFLSGLLFCAIPLRIYFMRAVMPESMAIASLLFGYYASHRWTQTERFWPWGIAAWAGLTLGPLLKLPYLPLIFPAFFLLWRAWGWKAWARPSVALFGALFTAAYGGWYWFAYSGGDARTAGFLTHEMRLVELWSNPDYWNRVFISRFPELLTTYAGLLFLPFGLATFWRKREWFPLVWFAATVVYALLCGGYLFIHQYAMLPFAAVNAVLIAAGISNRWDWAGSRRALKVGIAVLVLSIPVHAALRIRHWYQLHETWVLRASEAAQKASAPSDVFYVNAPDMPFYLYHLRRRGYVGRISEFGRDYFERARTEGAAFYFSPVNPEWEALKPEFNRRFKPVCLDPEFVIYDVRQDLVR